MPQGKALEPLEQPASKGPKSRCLPTTRRTFSKSSSRGRPHRTRQPLERPMPQGQLMEPLEQPASKGPGSRCLPIPRMSTSKSPTFGSPRRSRQPLERPMPKGHALEPLEPLERPLSTPPWPSAAI